MVSNFLQSKNLNHTMEILTRDNLEIFTEKHLLKEATRQKT